MRLVRLPLPSHKATFPRKRGGDYALARPLAPTLIRG
jgi:hypothetical protein